MVLHKRIGIWQNSQLGLDPKPCIGQGFRRFVLASAAPSGGFGVTVPSGSDDVQLDLFVEDSPTRCSGASSSAMSAPRDDQALRIVIGDIASSFSASSAASSAVAEDRGGAVEYSFDEESSSSPGERLVTRVRVFAQPGAQGVGSQNGVGSPNVLVSENAIQQPQRRVGMQNDVTASPDVLPILESEAQSLAQLDEQQLILRPNGCPANQIKSESPVEAASAAEGAFMNQEEAAARTPEMMGEEVLQEEPFGTGSEDAARYMQQQQQEGQGLGQSVEQELSAEQAQEDVQKPRTEQWAQQDTQRQVTAGAVHEGQEQRAAFSRFVKQDEASYEQVAQRRDDPAVAVAVASSKADGGGTAYAAATANATIYVRGGVSPDGCQFEAFQEGADAASRRSPKSQREDGRDSKMEQLEGEMAEEREGVAVERALVAGDAGSFDCDKDEAVLGVVGEQEASDQQNPPMNSGVVLPRDGGVIHHHHHHYVDRRVDGGESPIKPQANAHAPGMRLHEHQHQHHVHQQREAHQHHHVGSNDQHQRHQHFGHRHKNGPKKPTTPMVTFTVYPHGSSGTKRCKCRDTVARKKQAKVYHYARRTTPPDAEGREFYTKVNIPRRFADDVKTQEGLNHEDAVAGVNKIAAKNKALVKETKKGKPSIVVRVPANHVVRVRQTRQRKGVLIIDEFSTKRLRRQGPKQQ